MRCGICRDGGWIEVIHPSVLPEGATTPAGLVKCVCGQPRGEVLADGPSGYRRTFAVITRTRTALGKALATVFLAAILGLVAWVCALLGHLVASEAAGIGVILLCLVGTFWGMACELRLSRLHGLLRELEPYRGKSTPYTCPICASRWGAYEAVDYDGELCPKCRQ